MHNFYQEDLAFIHDVGYRDFALQASPGVLQFLQKAIPAPEVIVDLGCGSGIWAEALVKAGYSVWGLDLSLSMIHLAQARVPQAQFQSGSFFQEELPECAAVTALGEGFSYCEEPLGEHFSALQGLLAKIYRALKPGGLLIFDLVEPQFVPEIPVQSFREGEGWAVLVEKWEDRVQNRLHRRIVTFRQVAGHYRRTEEFHWVQLYRASEILACLRALGFRAKVMRRYGHYPLRPGLVAFMAKKNRSI